MFEETAHSLHRNERCNICESRHEVSMFLQKLYSLKFQTTFIAYLDNSTQLQEELNQKAQVSGLELRRGPEICALHLLPHHGISLTESQNVSRHATKNAGICKPGTRHGDQIVHSFNRYVLHLYWRGCSKEGFKTGMDASVFSLASFSQYFAEKEG